MSAAYYADSSVTLWHGDCLDVLRAMPDASVDAIVTDPPYGLEFMGKEWDSFKTYAGGNPNMKPQGATVGNSSAVSHGLRQKNPRCRRCGKLMRGNGSCKCPEPQPDTRTAEGANQFQFWCETWAAECLRVLKPGGHMLAFGGSRTWHRLACAVEDAGFEMRDSIAWLYGSGFPKSLDVSKAIDKAAGAEREVVGLKASNRPNVIGQRPGDSMGGGNYGERVDTAPATPDAARWQGWGTALKPAFEPIVVARKPFAGTVVANVLAWGTGALNIDGCRVAVSDADRANVEGREYVSPVKDSPVYGAFSTDGTRKPIAYATAGRWPTNVILDESQAAELDRQGAVSVSRVGNPRGAAPGDGWGMTATGAEYNDQGGASRFFPTFRYEAKAPTLERPRHGETAHPTVKPLDLMRWLVRLVTPPGGTVLDPFAGSGTTAEACVVEGFRCVLIEREADYLPLIVARLSKPIAPVLDFGASA